MKSSSASKTVLLSCTALSSVIDDKSSHVYVMLEYKPYLEVDWQMVTLPEPQARNLEVAKALSFDSTTDRLMRMHRLIHDAHFEVMLV